jgi:hypothetical protein
MLKYLPVVLRRFVVNVFQIVRCGKLPNVSACWHSAKQGIQFDVVLIRNQEEAAKLLLRTIDSIYALFGLNPHHQTGTIPFCRAVLLGIHTPQSEEEHRILRVSAEWQNFKIASCIAANLVVEDTIDYTAYSEKKDTLAELDVKLALALAKLGQDVTPRECCFIEAADAIGRGMPKEQAKWIVIKTIWPDAKPGIVV